MRKGAPGHAVHEMVCVAPGLQLVFPLPSSMHGAAGQSSDGFDGIIIQFSRLCDHSLNVEYIKFLPKLRGWKKNNCDDL